MVAVWSAQIGSRTHGRVSGIICLTIQRFTDVCSQPRLRMPSNNVWRKQLHRQRAHADVFHHRVLWAQYSAPISHRLLKPPLFSRHVAVCIALALYCVIAKANFGASLGASANSNGWGNRSSGRQHFDMLGANVGRDRGRWRVTWHTLFFDDFGLWTPQHRGSALVCTVRSVPGHSRGALFGGLLGATSFSSNN